MNNVINYDNLFAELVLKNAEGFLTPSERKQLNKLVEWKVKEVEGLEYAETVEDFDWE